MLLGERLIADSTVFVAATQEGDSPQHGPAMRKGADNSLADDVRSCR